MQKTKKKNILMVVTFLCSRLRVKLVKKNKKNPLRLLAVEQNDIKKSKAIHISVTSNQTKTVKTEDSKCFFLNNNKK